ncbi:MAG: hypothetical protein DRH32_01000 [Deltaproteobacteria bacterium]|nr:MAG: hypothetical protein DRH32_01000 [Deltaproteobacteria bacterium]
MHSDQKQASNRVYIYVIIGSLIVTIIIAGIFYRQKMSPGKTAKTSARTQEQAQAQAQASINSPMPVPKQPMVIDYLELDKDTATKNILQKRKEHYKIGTGVDVIIKSDESLKIGETTVSMQEIMDKIRLKHGDILEKTLDMAGMDAADQGTIRPEIFGIYIVRPGDNIWNIHFKFLKDYFTHRNITVSPMADEPGRLGLSSGIGKLLKFSENMVHIYNIAEHRLDVDLNLIQPLNKLVVYNMGQVFALLNQIDYSHVDHIRFDGETIWIQADR